MLTALLIAGIASLPILKDLDRVMSQRDRIEKEKTARIELVKAEISDPYERMDRLYEEYYQYHIDSTILYATRKMELALAEGNTWRIIDSRLDLANRYLMSGMYTDALKIADGIPFDDIGSDYRTRLYRTYHAIYDGLAQSSDDPALSKYYFELSHKYRNILKESLGEDELGRLYIDTDILRESGRYAEALQPVLNMIQKVDAIHDKAILHYLAANLYKALGDRRKAIEHYSNSAICDLTTPVREYRSLYELALLLHEEGDTDRAFRYIIRSIEDANSVNAKMNIEYINRRPLPVITSAYDSLVRKRRSEMLSFIIILAIVLILLVFVSAACLAAMRRTRAANEALVQANSLKEFYIARYIDMCSDYIDGLDHFRNEMRKITQRGNITNVLNALKSKELIENELKALYASFDASFIDIYPDFVEKVNLLLRDDCRIELNDAKTLTTELRVAALLRLGVTDSADIAHFLRRSVSTIYNCRVHLRNCARSDRDSFEAKLMQIGRF